MTSDPLRPSAGVRFLLERTAIAADEASATYTASIITPTQRHELLATLFEDGRADISPAPTPGDGDRPDASDLKRLDGIARTIARAARKNRADGLPAWPARILRWRGPGRG